jgi:hypothetical protein
MILSGFAREYVKVTQSPPTSLPRWLLLPAIAVTFNDESDPLKVLVCNDVCSPARYNLQRACRYVHLLDPPPSESAKKQTYTFVPREKLVNIMKPSLKARKNLA